MDNEYLSFLFKILNFWGSYFINLINFTNWLKYPVADLFLDLLVTHPDNLVGLDIRELKVDLVSHDFLFLVRIDNTVDCPLQDEIGT